MKEAKKPPRWKRLPRKLLAPSWRRWARRGLVLGSFLIDVVRLVLELIRG
ncbi:MULTISPECIES: hypothetical protein [Streptomyces]|nr:MULTISPECIES: hypothetical protein [unclassified Streptomyces]MDT0424383.1 hypothetical protein [Streptomyces sp. DSM 41859]